MNIRPERPADSAAIRIINEQAIGSLNEANLVDLLRAAGKAPISLVADQDDYLVGHILFSPVTLSPPRPDLKLIGLAPLAVLPTYQSQGIGTHLVRAGLEQCRQQGYDAVVVLGNPAYYGRFGFTRASAHNLGNEYGVDKHFMALELRPDVLVGAAGTIRYAPEFQEAGT